MTSGICDPSALLGIAVILSLNYVLVWPMLHAWNAILALVCNNGPMGLDIDAYFPEARSRFE